MQPAIQNYSTKKIANDRIIILNENAFNGEFMEKKYFSPNGRRRIEKNQEMEIVKKNFTTGQNEKCHQQKFIKFFLLLKNLSFTFNFFLPRK